MKKNKSIIKVYIDTAEKNFVKKSTMFFKKQNIPHEQKSLEDGDLNIVLKTHDVFCVERKRYDDFASSYITGHLQDQAVRMNKNQKYYAVIIHGGMDDIYRAANYNPALKRIKNKKTIDKMYHRMELIYKCPCFFVDSDVEYFTTVMAISETLAKASGLNMIVKSEISVKKNKPLSILMQAEKIGQKTAELLLKEFGSPKAVLSASRDELLEINGVGDGTVTELKRLKEAYDNGKEI